MREYLKWKSLGKAALFDGHSTTANLHFTPKSSMTQVIIGLVIMHRLFPGGFPIPV